MRRRYLLASFLVPTLVRAIPEVVSFPWPIGYDTVYLYAPLIHVFQIYGFFPGLFYCIYMKYYSLPFYIIIGGLGILSQADPFLILKVVAPFLCGFLGFSIFYFCSHFLGWGDEKSLFCTILSTVYFVSLGLSFGFFRNILSLGFFFLAVSETKNLNKWKNTALFSLLSFMCAFSHEVVTLILLFVMIYIILAWIYDRWRGKSTVSMRGLVGPSLSVLFCVLFTLLYMGNFGLYSSGGLLNNKLSILVDYTSWKWEDVGFYPTTIDLGHHILLFFLFCYAPLLPFVLWGYFKCRPLDAMSLLLLGASFMPLVLPHSALPYWWRWMIILVFPFTVYTSNALFPSEGETIVRKWLENVFYYLEKRYSSQNPTSKILGVRFSRRRIFLAFVVLVSVLSFTFMVFPYEHPFPYYSNTVIQLYFPPSMQANTFPISECDEAMLATIWLNWNMPQNSCLIAHEKLLGWARLNINFRPIYSYSGVNTGLLQALEQSSLYNSTYVITTWNYDYFIRTSGFNLVFNLGQIEVFKK
jgi:hypothetical protein